MSYHESRSNVIHSRDSSRTMKPYPIGVLKSIQTNQFPLSQRFELRPTTTKEFFPKKDTSTSMRPKNVLKSRNTDSKSILVQTRESLAYPMILFCQKSLRPILKEVKFEGRVKSLRQEDIRFQMILGIVQELFNELSVTALNILICQHLITRAFQIYLTDCEYVPISKCCKAPVRIDITQVSQGQMVCMGVGCQIKTLSVFTIQPYEIDKLWAKDFDGIQHMELFNNRISNYITTGKYRALNISREVKRRSKTFNGHKNLLHLNLEQSQENPCSRGISMKQSDYTVIGPISKEENSFINNTQYRMEDDFTLQPEPPQSMPGEEFKIKSPVQFRFGLVEKLILNGKVFKKEFHSKKSKQSDTEQSNTINEIKNLVQQVVK